MPYRGVLVGATVLAAIMFTVPAVAGGDDVIGPLYAVKTQTLGGVHGGIGQIKNGLHFSKQKVVYGFGEVHNAIGLGKATVNSSLSNTHGGLNTGLQEGLGGVSYGLGHVGNFGNFFNHQQAE